MLELNPLACNAKSPVDRDGMVWYCGWQADHIDPHDWEAIDDDLPPIAGRWEARK